ncbi:MAG: hypothetical protein EOM46_10900 [Gammaproteobacteria bacterium]|nr:hypothetical protein [Gammaproteobacteria bacterium]
MVPSVRQIRPARCNRVLPYRVRAHRSVKAVVPPGPGHRVILGPYSSRATAEQSLSRLKGAGTVQSCTIYAQ